MQAVLPTRRRGESYEAVAAALARGEADGAAAA
jgi:hypothetical protein